MKKTLLMVVVAVLFTSCGSVLTNAEMFVGAWVHEGSNVNIRIEYSGGETIEVITTEASGVEYTTYGIELTESEFRFRPFDSFDWDDFHSYSFSDNNTLILEGFDTEPLVFTRL